VNPLVDYAWSMNPGSEFTPADMTRRLDVLNRLLLGIQKAVGHELPNQIVAQRGMLQLLEMEDGERLSDNGRDYLRRVSAATSRAGNLIGALSEIVRFFRQPHVPEAVILAEVAHEAGLEVIRLFPGTNIEYDLLESLPLLAVPRRALQMALVHLLRNGAGAALPDRPMRIVVRAQPSATSVDVAVIDNGSGIAANRGNRLFEPFPGFDPNATGIGLGLFVARLLVDSWGGTIRFDSDVGRGSTFTFSAPIVERNPTVSSESRTAE
jgi:signal transduction histidine kinase